MSLLQSDELHPAEATITEQRTVLVVKPSSPAGAGSASSAGSRRAHRWWRSVAIVKPTKRAAVVMNARVIHMACAGQKHLAARQVDQILVLDRFRSRRAE